MAKLAIQKFIEKDPRWTWLSHYLATAIPPLAVVIPLSIFTQWSPEPLLSYACLNTGIAMYYILIREQLDEIKKRKEGTYDTPDHQGITGRMDKTGDQLGPFCAALSTWIAYGLSFL